MIGYIICLVIGGIIIIISAIFFGSKLHKNHDLKKLTKKLGQTAEKIINADIKTWAKHTDNKFIEASLYKYDFNKVFEVDSILITDRAIIVIEIKSIKGKVVGNAKKQIWKKVTSNNMEYNLSNPVMQNDKHIYHIQKMSKTKFPIVSLIVYANRTEGIEVSDIPEHAVIIRHAELYDTLDKISAALERKLDPQQIKDLYHLIKKHRTNKINDKELHNNITKAI